MGVEASLPIGGVAVFVGALEHEHVFLADVAMRGIRRARAHEDQHRDVAGLLVALEDVQPDAFVSRPVPGNVGQIEHRGLAPSWLNLGRSRTASEEPIMSERLEALKALSDVIDRLRAPDGCPWDLK